MSNTTPIIKRLEEIDLHIARINRLLTLLIQKSYPSILANLEQSPPDMCVPDEVLRVEAEPAPPQQEQRWIPANKRDQIPADRDIQIAVPTWHADGTWWAYKVETARFRLGADAMEDTFVTEGNDYAAENVSHWRDIGPQRRRKCDIHLPSDL